MLIYFCKLILLFFIFHHNFCNHKVDKFFKGFIRCNNFSTNEFSTSNSFIYRDFYSVSIFNIPHKNVLSSSYRFYQFRFYFYEYWFFIYTVFYNIFNVNSFTNIFNNDLHITYLFNRNNRFLFRNYKVAGEYLNILHQRKVQYA